MQKHLQAGNLLELGRNKAVTFNNAVEPAVALNITHKLRLCGLLVNLFVLHADDEEEIFSAPSPSQYDKVPEEQV